MCLEKTDSPRLAEGEVGEADRETSPGKESDIILNAMGSQQKILTKADLLYFLPHLLHWIKF